MTHVAIMIIFNLTARFQRSKSRAMNMKAFVVVLSMVGSAMVVANEDHLILVPKPVWDGESIFIVQTPFVSGYGTDFEGYCPKIAKPSYAERNSPSRRDKDDNKEDVNPASIAGIQLSAELGPDSFYDVTIRYDKVKEEHWRSNTGLLRAVVQCIYQYGDSVENFFKVRFKLTGVPPESGLHAELAKCIEDRKKSDDKTPNLPPRKMNMKEDWTTIEKKNYSNWELAEFDGWSGVADGGSIGFRFLTTKEIKFDVLVANPSYWTAEDKEKQRQVIYLVESGRFYLLKRGSEHEKLLIGMLKRLEKGLKKDGLTSKKRIEVLREVIGSRKAVNLEWFLTPEEIEANKKRSIEYQEDPFEETPPKGRS